MSANIEKMDKQKYLDRFDEMIALGESFLEKPLTKEKLEDVSILKWRINCVSLLDQVLPPQSIHREILNSFHKGTIHIENLKYKVVELKAIKEDYEKGFLGDLES